MIKLKTISLLRCRTELASLPEGKLLINTINATMRRKIRFLQKLY